MIHISLMILVIMMIVILHEIPSVMITGEILLFMMLVDAHTHTIGDRLRGDIPRGHSTIDKIHHYIQDIAVVVRDTAGVLNVVVDFTLHLIVPRDHSRAGRPQDSYFRDDSHIVFLLCYFHNMALVNMV